jgi:hypothetical protein
MATINLGSIKFNWQGAYAGGTAYAVDDVVSYNGSSYVCILASTGNLPTNATYFEQMSSAGTNGTDGTDLGTTLTTQGDIVYRDGSGLARLGAGTAGEALITNGAGANPSWGSVAGGKVLQVVTLSDTTGYQRQGTGTSDCPNYNISITPSSASSKVMIIMSITHNTTDSLGTSEQFAQGEAFIRDVTNGTDLADLSDQSYYIGNGSSYEQTLKTTASRTILHSPSTTSSITYSVRLSSPSSGNVSASSDFIGILMEIGA